MKFDVVTFGSAVIDVFVDGDIAEKKGFISYPIGEKILLKNLKYDIGGGGTNTAVAFSRLGFKTGYIGKVGKDINGNEILHQLKKEKVKFLGKRTDKGMTGYSVILDSKSKDRTILTYKGVNNNIKEKDIKKFKTKWLYFSSLLERSFQTQLKVAKKLCSRGAKLAFNPSSYLIKEKNLSSILKLTSILVLNKEEAEMLSKKAQIEEIIKRLHSFGPNIIVITDKNKNIVASDKNKIYKLKPHRIKVIERTGAGDAFASGFTAGIIIGRSIQDALKLGLEESESVIRYFGAKNNLIKRKLK